MKKKKNECPRCNEDMDLHKSRRDEKIKDNGSLFQYIHCWYCGSMVEILCDGKSFWYLDNPVKSSYDN